MKVSFKLALMASAITSMVAIAASAQDAAAPVAPAIEDNKALTTVVVAANRNDAARIQMKSDNTVSVMSSEDLERTAVHNVAEALALLPGVSVSNTGNSFFGGVEGASRGEGMFISVRGMNSEFTLALINGVNVAQGMPYSRQVQLSLLPPTGLKTIVVNKNSTADMDGDAMGGTVDFRTPTAFNFTTDSHTSVSLSGRLESRARDYGDDGLGGGVNGEFARKFGDTQQFGLYVSAFYDKRNYVNSQIAALMNAQNDGGWGYLHSATSDATGVNPAGMDKEANLVLTGLNAGTSSGSTERYGGNFSLDWNVDDTLILYARGSYAFAETQQNSTLTQFVNDKARVFNTATGLYDLNLTGSSVRVWYTTNPQDADLGTLTFGAVKRAGNWTLSPSVFYSEGDNDRPEHIEASMRNNQTDNFNTGAFAGRVTPYSGLFIGYDKDSLPIPLLTTAQSNLINNANTALLARRAGQLTEQFSGQTKAGGRFDARYDFDSGPLEYIKTGVKYVGSHRRVISRDWTNDHFANIAKRPGVTWADLGLATDYHDAAYPGLYEWRTPKVNHERLFELFYQNFNRTAAFADLCYLNCNTLKGDENVAAAYITGKYDLGTLEVIPGLRFENTRIENTYWNNDAKAKRFETNKTEYNEWLPSLYVNYRPETGNAIYRAALTRAYMRPALIQLANVATTSRGDRSITVNVGNPDLKTLKSWNFDLSGEWNYAEGGYAMTGAFYKDLSDYMFDAGQTQVNRAGTTSNNTTYNGETFESVTFNRPTNGGDGYVKGLEVQVYQKLTMMPGLMSGLGVGANLTRQWTQVDIGKGEKHHMQNAPEVLANLKVNYTYKGLTLDVNHNYTGRSVINYNRIAGLDTWTRPTKRTDLHAGYDFGNGLQLDLSVSNVFKDYSYWSHVGKNSLAISDVVDSGSTTLLTLKYSY